ncbi:hypothetical protein ACOSP7_015529 [Xanthoceras sorbifolium]
MSWTEGDWMCAACQHHNFRQRVACQRCGYPKFGGPDVTTYLDNRTATEVLAGDWFCTTINCGAHNYASRSNCYRCGALKSANIGANMNGSHQSAGCSNPPGWKAGDWICNSMGCGVHNYAWRTECYKCKTTKE